MPKAEPTHGICLVMVHEDIGCHVHLFRKWQKSKYHMLTKIDILMLHTILIYHLDLLVNYQMKWLKYMTQNIFKKIIF